MHFILKRLYACVEIRQGKVNWFSSKLPPSFIRDLEDVIRMKKIVTGNIYICGSGAQSRLKCSSSLKKAIQRLHNIWGLYKSRYK